MRGKGVTIGARGTSGIASLISGMTLRERRALHESVKRRILSEVEESTETSMLRAGVYDDKDDNYDGYDLFIPDGEYEWLLRKHTVAEGETRIFIIKAPSKDAVNSKNFYNYAFFENGKTTELAKSEFKGVTYQTVLAALKDKNKRQASDIDAFLSDPKSYFEKQNIPPAPPAAPAPSAPAPSAPAADKNEPSDESPTGARLMKGDIEVFRKTDSGWKATLRLTLPQILSIIKPEYQPEVKEDLTALGDRDELPITRGYLKNPGMSFTGGGLTFQRDGELFADPVAVPGVKLPDIMKNLGLKYDVTKERSGDAADTAAGKEEAWAVGNVIFKKIRADKMTITVQDDGSGTYADFSSIFGARADVPRLIQKAAKKNGGKIDLIKIPLRFADESSLMGKFGGFLGMGAIKFEKEDDKFVCTLERPALVGRAVEVLNDMADEGVNRARKLASASGE